MWRKILKDVNVKSLKKFQAVSTKMKILADEEARKRVNTASLKELRELAMYFRVSRILAKRAGQQSLTKMIKAKI